MKKIITSLALGFFMIPACLNAADTAADVSLDSNVGKISYSMGLDLGRYLKTMEGKIDFTVIKQGIEDGFAGAEPKLSDQEMAAAKAEFEAMVKAEQEAALNEMMTKNAEAGSAYLEENKGKDGVAVTDSGLQYEVINEGDGPKPEATDTVKVDYVGSLIDGTVFDSSVERGEPAVFPVNQVIPGWTEALQLMPVGSKYRVVIPAELAYGEKGAAPVIQPNSVLVFEIDLLGIE